MVIDFLIRFIFNFFYLIICFLEYQKMLNQELNNYPQQKRETGRSDNIPELENELTTEKQARMVEDLKLEDKSSNMVIFKKIFVSNFYRFHPSTTS